MNAGVPLFLKKLSFLVIPAVLFLVAYATLDPFKVVRAHRNFYELGSPSYVSLNRDFVSTETFIRNYPSQRYDSFILGNSRSLFFLVDDWRRHIDSDRCFHFDASGETLWGIARKIDYLDRHGVKIKNALFIIDASTLASVTNSPGHLAIKDPVVSGESHLRFQLEFLKAFSSPWFLVAYIHFKVSGKIHPYMLKAHLLDNRPMDYDTASNEITFPYYETMIAENPAAYYQPRQGIFYPRAQNDLFSAPKVGSRQKTLLAGVAEILKRHHANYRIVISPLYDQVRLNPADLECLQNIFDPKAVFDFSGRNSLTEPYQNYYEASHYRPHVARAVMDTIYASRN